MRKFVPSGEENPVNELMLFSKEFEQNVQHIAANANDKLIRDLSFQGVLFIIYVCLVLLLSLYISRRVAIDIGQPLGQLAQQASQFGRGHVIHLEDLEREDELGELARSFNDMMVQIQAKEEELLAQNEELIAQQDELQAQQEELQQVVETLEENEVYLTNRNAFIQALANTLDKQELLDSIINNLVRFSDFDKGILVLLNTNNDYAPTAFLLLLPTDLFIQSETAWWCGSPRRWSHTSSFVMHPTGSALTMSRTFRLAICMYRLSMGSKR